ncbi:MAG: allantoate amidohydrolase [Pseudomonadota bacterium]|nr:allantoate amidohydrolase [Pseudomonadota bacterium]
MNTTAPRAPAAGAMGAAIAERLAQLAGVSDEAGALTRLYLSPAHRRAAEIVINWMREAGMTARIDAVGNVVGRREAAGKGAKTLILGSHIDTVRDAGAYDGNLGVVTAIEVVGALKGQALSFAIEVAAFGDEEGVRFASALGGSRALAGAFDPAILDERDAEGISRRDALAAFGCDPGRIAEEARAAEDVIGYVEVHIEQGPVLEAENRPVGVVTGISGACRGVARVVGTSAHAGATPMSLRRDALVAAGLMIAAVEARARLDPDLVATVGRLDIAHAAANTIPGAVSFTLDIRASDDEVRRAAARDIAARIRDIADARGLAAQVELGYEAPFARCDARLSDALAASIAHVGLDVRRLPSGAGHDAMAFKDRAPFAMLFVRCKAGVSHNPAEYASPQDIDVGARVLLDFVKRLAP